MDRNAVAMVLEEIGTLLDLHGENQFRAKAFHAAARALLDVPGDIVALAESGKLADVRGFGAVTAEIVREIVTTGASRYHHDLRERTPPGLFECLQVPGLGAKRIYLLRDELGVEGLDSLEAAATEGRIASLKGFGEKTQAKILDGIAFVKSTSGRRRQPAAFRAAEMLVGFLEAHPEVKQVKLAGELRRRMETVDGVDVIASTTKAEPVLRAFEELPGVARTWRPDDRSVSARLADGLEIRLRCVPPVEFPTAWAYATGSAAHVEALEARARKQGMRLDMAGLWKADGKRVRLRDEAGLYAALDIAFIEPELREDGTEVRAAASKAMPTLVRYTDLRGCFHCHTTWSDGKATIEEMAEACIARGWRYWGIADHSKAAHYAGGLTSAQVIAQIEAVDAWNAERGDELWIFKGIEADILPDGTLDFSDEPGVLDRFDYVVGSVHSAFGLPREEMTARLVRAVRDPHLTFLGHPTGRLLLSRNAYAVDVDAVVDAAIEEGVGIEINCNPARLDLDWRYWRSASERGLVTAVSPDAHSVGGLADVEFGIGVARKGWLEPADIVNTWEIERVKEFFERTKRRKDGKAMEGGAARVGSAAGKSDGARAGGARGNRNAPGRAKGRGR